MTRAYDLAAVEALDGQPDLFGALPEPEQVPRDLIVRPSSVAFARPHIVKGHYSGIMPDSTTEVYAAFYGETHLAGLCAFGMGANYNTFTGLIPDIQHGEYRELNRLWVDDNAPRNTASRLVSEALRMLPEQVKLVVSFADPERDHAGYVYQSTNWLFCGTTEGDVAMVDADGNKMTRRLIHIYKMRRPELADMTSDQIKDVMGWTTQRTMPKFRYVMLRGNRTQRKALRRAVDRHVIDRYPKQSDIDALKAAL